MSNKTLAAIGGAAIAICLGIVLYVMWPKPIPSFSVKDAEGETLTVRDLHGDKDLLVLVFLLPNCQVSKFSLGLLKKEYETHAAKLAFAGLVFGNQNNAAKLIEAEEIPFPVYGLRDAPDPFAMQELIEVVGSSRGLGSAVWGGTVVVVDRDGDIELKLEKDELRELPAKLAKLAD